MASSSNLNRTYDVFLSFRGMDVRKNFLSHLYAALDEKGTHTFVDREELRIGEQISAAIVRAIEESRVAIIIFSEDYAFSPWCLEEVVKIMECHKQKGLIVYPVFYKVEPREVRCGRESYGRAMANHESKFGKDSEKVRRWKKALFDAGSLSGWNSNDSDEAELIRRIIKELSVHLDRTPLHVAKYPVGIKSRVQELISFLEKESGDDDDVLMIGIWGPGGIGKTTIAKALYNAIERHFQGSSFLARVRETSNQSNGLVALQEKLLSHILFHKNVTVYNVDRGINLIRERLRCKKVLLILDDVDRMDQLNALAGEGDWFGKGSRIIVTSRDKHLLTSHGINRVYEVQCFGYEEALELFGQHAFPNGKRAKMRRDLIDTALHYADGLPLALEVLGSFLCGRNESTWESALNKLSKSPSHSINQVLKTSFDGLDDNEKEIFLDIACFFKGNSVDYIQKILEGCDFNTIIGVEILIERSLIKNENGTLQMHDLVQLMGKDIVDKQCRDDPGKRSRIWLFEDFMSILYENTEKNAVKAIVLNRRAPENIIISPDAFANMKKLRILILLEVHISSPGPIRLPNELRWLKWPNAPDLEFNSGPKKLMSLDVHNSLINQFGGEFHNLRKLQSINFRGCKFLASIPDLSSVPNLEILNLSECKSLVEVHQSVGYLEKLKYLSLSRCSNLSEFPSILKTKHLEYLNLFSCTKLEKFPDITVKMEHLESIRLRGSAIKELPASIENLVSMKEIDLGYCKNLARLPSSIYKLKNLRSLDLIYCSNFVMFPKNLKDSINTDGDLGFQNLEELCLDGCNLSDVEFLKSSSSFPKLADLGLSGNKFNHLPTWIGSYDYWKGLFALESKQLQEIPRLTSNMGITEANSSNFLHKLQDSSSLPSYSLEVNSSSWCNVADVSPLEKVPKTKRFVVCLSGREMPEWILHCQEGFISFMVHRDLYDKFLGLALCAVFGPKEGKESIGGGAFELSVNGERVLNDMIGYHRLESENVWLIYLSRSSLDVKEEVMRNDWSHFHVRFIPWTSSLKKCGFRLFCEEKEDDLWVCTPTPSADAKQIENLNERDSGKRQFSVHPEEDDSPVKRDSTKKMRWS